MFTSGLTQKPPNMSQTKITPLESKYLNLPKYIKFSSDILPELEKATPPIARRTFERDLKADPNTIPTGRLKVYSQIFACSIDDLLNGYSKIKVKAVVKTSIVKKSGLRTSIFIGLMMLYAPCFGQKHTIRLDTLQGMHGYRFSNWYTIEHPVLKDRTEVDTMKVFMLVTDTSKIIRSITINGVRPLDTGSEAFLVKGYSVSNNHYGYYYLDERKNPIPKTWIVWISFVNQKY